MPSLEAERLLRIARRDLRMAGRLLDPEVEEASWGWALQQTLENTQGLVTASRRQASPQP